MLTCNINIQSTSPVNTKEQLAIVTYTKAQLLETLISYSIDNTLTFTGWYTPIRSTAVHQTGMLLHPVHPKYTQHPKSTLLHLPKRCLYTSLYTATTEDIRPTIGKLLQGRRCLKIAQMLQDHHMRPHFFPLQYSCVLCQKWFEPDKTQGGSS